MPIPERDRRGRMGRRLGHEDRRQGVEPDAAPSRRGHHRGGQLRVAHLDQVEEQARPPESLQGLGPGGLVPPQAILQVEIVREQLGANDLQPGVGVVLSLGPEVILEEAAETVVNADETHRHARLAAGPDRLVWEPARFFTQADRATLVGHRIKRPVGHENDHADQHAQRSQPARHPMPRRRRSIRFRAAEDDRRPLAEVPGRDRAHDRRELVRVPRGFQADEAEGHEQQKAKRARSPGQSHRFPHPSLPGLVGLPLGTILHDRATLRHAPGNRQEETQCAQDHRAQVQ